MTRLATLMLAGALGLAACGVKGPLEPPPGEPDVAPPQGPEELEQIDQPDDFSNGNRNYLAPTPSF